MTIETLLSEKEAQAAPLNIYQRINEVRKSVAYLKKEKEVAGRYMVITHDQVTAAIRDSLIEQCIIVVPHFVSSTQEDTKTTTGKGIPYIRYAAIYDVCFVCGDIPRDPTPHMITMRVEAHAMDEGDKAPGKCLSYAVKAAELKLFSIETGEDDEERPEQKKEKRPEFKDLSDDDRENVMDADNKMRILISNKDYAGALAEWHEYDHDPDSQFDKPAVQTILWFLFTAEERRLMKATKKGAK